MKLGKLLLQGLRKKNGGKRHRARTPKRVKRVARQAKPRSLFRAALSEKSRKQDVPAQTLPAVVVQKPVAIEPERPSVVGPRITLSRMIRPDEKLKESIEAFLLDQRSEHTRRAYGKDLKRFIQFLHARNLLHATEGKMAQEIDRLTIIAYKEMLLAEGLEHTSVDRHLATLRSFFRWLVDDGHLEKNPAEGVRFMNPRRLSKTVGFSDEEVRRVLAMPDLHTRTGAQHYAILMVLFHCGLRRSELCSLKMSHIGVERDHPVIRLRGKGNAERMIVLVPAVWNALKHYFLITGRSYSSPASADRYVFSPIRNNRTGELDRPLDTSMIFYIVRRYSKLAGIVNPVSPHSCRATAISNARDHHVPDRAIQEFAGWASPDMITRYDKRKTSIEKSAAKAIQYGEGDRSLPAFTGADISRDVLKK